VCKMRKISLIPYKIADGEEKKVPGKVPGEIDIVKTPDVMYPVREFLAEILFLPALKIGARDLIEHDRIARKIEAAGDDILLEEGEYTRLLAAIDTFQGYSRGDLELIKRVTGAAEIDANTPSTGGN